MDIISGKSGSEEVHVFSLLSFGDGDQYDIEPFIRFIIQLFLILALSYIIRIPIKYLKQPRVIAEMLAGIVLGPSALGLIPGFSEVVFPESSMGVIQVNAEIGLCCYLFLVGMQLDFSLLMQNHYNYASNIDNRNSKSFLIGKVHKYLNLAYLDIKNVVGMPALVATVGTVGSLIMAFPIAIILFSIGQSQWCPPSTPLLPFAIFLGVGMGVSALSVVSRILSERSMMNLPLGVFTMASGSVALLETWILGELSTSFIYVGWSPLRILWNVLIAIADLVILVTVLRPVLVKIVKRVEEEQELSMSNFFYIVLIVLGYSSLAEYTTLTASLGAMFVGMVMPRGSSSSTSSGGIIVRQQLGDRLEDVMTLFFLPLFITYSGLRTRLIMFQPIDIGICLLIFVVSFGSKAVSCAIASRVVKIFPLRESICFGVLMQAKGLMALIIFNNAYDAGIITSRMFSIMVVFVVLSTVVTTPLVGWILPKRIYVSKPYPHCKNQFCALVCPQTDQHGKAMASIVAALLGSNTARQREHQLPDRMVAVKLLKDTQRSSTPFTSLSFRREGFQRNLIKRDPVFAAVRKRVRDINVPSNLLHTEQKLHVSTGDIRNDVVHLIDSLGADFVMLSGPRMSQSVPTAYPLSAGLPPLALTVEDIASLPSAELPKDIGVFYDRGTVQRRVGRVLCAVLLGYEKAGSCALKLCAKMRPKVDVQVLHIMAPGIGDNLGVLNNLINTCTQKSMEYKVAVNSNPIAALFEELGAINVVDNERDSGLEEVVDNGSEAESSDNVNIIEQPYSLLVIGDLPSHLADFILNRVTCSTLVIYPRFSEVRTGTESPVRSLEENSGSLDIELEETEFEKSDAPVIINTPTPSSQVFMSYVPNVNPQIAIPPSGAKLGASEEPPPVELSPPIILQPPMLPQVKTPADAFIEMPVEIWARVCTFLELPEIGKLHIISQALNNVMSNNFVWAEITTTMFPESQPNATAGINWKQMCLLYHSKKYPHLALRAHGGPGPGPGRFYLLSILFMGDETEMGNAESMFFLKKISNNAAITSAAPKGGVMNITYGHYYLLSLSMTQIAKVPMFWERSAAIVVSCLHRTNHNTNMETIFNKKTLAGLHNVLQQASPTAPLVVFFHYNNPANNTNSNSAVDSVFVQKLNDIMSELILKSSFPLRKLLVQPYNFRSNFGFSDGLWWMSSNIAPLPMSVEQLQLTWQQPPQPSVVGVHML